MTNKYLNDAEVSFERYKMNLSKISENIDTLDPKTIFKAGFGAGFTSGCVESAKESMNILEKRDNATSNKKQE